MEAEGVAKEVVEEAAGAAAVAAAANVNARSAKEREAFARQYPNMPRPGSLTLASGEPDHDDDGGSRSPSSGRPVVVHQDGGRVRSPPPDEIPPTYDSIPPEERLTPGSRGGATAGPSGS